MKLDDLYELLPAVYRIRDIQGGRPLQAIMRVIGEQATYLHADIEQLYENLFIETCQDWAVPYLGELVGFRRSHSFAEPGDVHSTDVQLLRQLYPRREVSQLIRARRRKGTLPVFEELSLNVAGWRSLVIEHIGFIWVSRAPSAPGVAAATITGVPAFAGPLTSSVARTPSLLNQFQPHFTNALELRTWRREARQVGNVQPTLICDACAGWRLLSFSPFGFDYPLAINPNHTDPSALPPSGCQPTAVEHDMQDMARTLRQPRFIRRSMLEAGPESEMYQQIVDHSVSISAPVEYSLHIADLTDCLTTLDTSGNKLFLDPDSGRLAVPPSVKVRATFHQPRKGRIGGGTYGRAVAQHLDFPVFRFLPRQDSVVNALAFGSLFYSRPQIETLDDDRVEIASSVGFEFASNEVQPIRLNTLTIRRNQTLELRASNRTRPVLRMQDQQGQLQAITIKMEPGSRLIVDGLTLIAERIRIEYLPVDSPPAPIETDPCAPTVNHRRELPPEVFIRHSTIAPAIAAHSIPPPDGSCMKIPHPGSRLLGHLQMDVPGGKLTIRNSVLGSIELAPTTGTSCPDEPIDLAIYDSIIDREISADPSADKGDALAKAFARLTCQRSTFLSSVRVHQIVAADDCIFKESVRVDRPHEGYFRFCYVPIHCDLPRRYKCVPESWDDSRKPSFVEERFGHFGYAELTTGCTDAISQGAESQSEMGAFHDLYEPQRRQRLQNQLNEFTPADMSIYLVFADEVWSPS